MNNIIQLTKVFLKTSFTKYNGTSNTKEKTGTKKVLSAIGIIILIAYLAGIFGFVSYNMITLLNQAGQPALFLGVALLSIAILLLIQTLISSMNLFYFSKDIEYILPLPLKPYEIVIAKFNTLLITEYIVVFMFLLAPFIIYGVLTGASALFYLYGLLVLLIFPILPALISSIIVMIAMRFSKLTKNKDKFQVIATILLIIAVIFIQMQMAGTEEASDEEMIQMITQFNGLLDQVDNYFITLEDSINALLNCNNINGLISMLKLTGITILAYVIFIVLAQKIYLKGAVGASYSGKKKKTQGNAGITYKKQNAGLTYVKKEFITLFKNPIFFTQCILPSILMPIIMCISVIAGAGGLEEMKAEGVEMFEISNTLGLCVILGINVLLYTMNFIAVTAISRDGSNAVFMKYIPLELSKQCTYKIVPSVVMNVVSTSIIIIIAEVFFKISILFALINVVVAILTSILYSYLMIIVDLKRPKLKWDTEYAVVKQNMNMMFEFILTLIIIFAIVGIAIIMEKIPYVITAGIITAILLLGIYAIRKYIDKKQVKLFEKVQ